MTPEEIKKLSEECALHYQGRPSNKGYELSNRLTIESYALMTLRWLSKDYIIIPKSKVKEEWDFWRQRLPKNCNLANEVNNNPDTARMWGKIEVLNDLFGPKLFNEKKE